VNLVQLSFATVTAQDSRSLAGLGHLFLLVPLVVRRRPTPQRLHDLLLNRQRVSR